MIVQLERIAPRGGRRLRRRCATAGCLDAATWYLVDRDDPVPGDANLGELPCCTEHIAATYLLIRGASVVARGSTVSAPLEARRGIDRRRTHTRASISVISGDVAANGTV